MKYTHAFYLVICVLVTVPYLISCGGQYEPPLNVNDVLYVAFDSIRPQECCLKRHWFTVIDSNTHSWNWYWAAIVKEGTSSIIRSGNPQSMIMHNNVYMDIGHYEHKLDSGTYKFHIFRCDNNSDAGVDSLATAHGECPVPIVIDISQFEDSCNTDCCNGEYFYVTAKKKEPVVEEVIGARANIKYRFGKLCRQDFNPNIHSHYAAYVGINAVEIPEGQSPNHGYWAQTGYQVRRGVWDTLIIGVYFEHNVGPGTWILDWRTQDFALDYSYEGDTATFHLELDTTSSAWNVYHSGVKWLTFPHNYWSTNKGISVQWTGEIFGRETDMPGTESNKCIFRDCKYKEYGENDFWDADFRDEHAFNPDYIGSDDVTNWLIKLETSNMFSIWDIYPQPEY